MSLVNRQLNFISNNFKKVEGVVAVWEEAFGNSNDTDQQTS